MPGTAEQRALALMKISLLLTLLFLTGLATASDDWSIHARGYGSVHVGMTVKDAEVLLKSPLVLEKSPLEDGCFVAIPKNGHKGVYFRVENGKITHSGVTTAGVPSDVGLKVGDSASEVKRRYGKRLEVMKHHYQDNAFYFFVWEKNRKYGMNYEIGDNGKIHEIRGGNSTIMRVEGPCS